MLKLLIAMLSMQVNSSTDWNCKWGRVVIDWHAGFGVRVFAVPAGTSDAVR
jgi:hypothetical protein